ncbi:MAG TPA: response regulator [Pirellula sp.]|nr:response regulator [Pirellula sp.]
MADVKRVLVAEDNVVLGDVIRFNLQRSGFAVTLARNGEEALRLVASQPFDVLVTDYEMPGLDGEELCARVRNELKLDSIRIVMCSAKGLELDREELKARLCIEAILYKPFSIRELTTLLDSLAITNSESAPTQLVSN